MAVRSLTVALVILLAASCASARDAQRKLMQECSLSALAWEMPEAATMLQIISAFNLLPDGIPADATIFLPNNAATARLPAALDLPFTVDTLIIAADALGPALKQRLVSVVAYHVAPIGSLGPAELPEERDLLTALNGTALLATQIPIGGTVLTDTSGGQANVVAGPAPIALAACQTSVYLIDNFLMPAVSLTELPRTTVAEAQAILGGPDDSGAVPPAAA